MDNSTGSASRVKAWVSGAIIEKLQSDCAANRRPPSRQIGALATMGAPIRDY